MKKATLIYNPVAGRNPRKRERQIREAARALEAAGVAAKLAPTSGPGAAGVLAATAARERVDLILVCGGDGTVNEVINGLAPSDVPLGILPGGTANIIAKELRLPHDPVRAARELPRWAPRRIALGHATWNVRTDSGTLVPERRFFHSVAGIGFDAYVIHKLSTRFKMSLGAAAYVLEALRQTWRYSFPTFQCLADGRDFEAAFAVLQRALRYGGWLELAPGASIFQPNFALCLFKSRRWFRFFVYAAAVLARQHLRLSDVQLVEAAEVVCSATSAERPVFFELDGELAGELPATFEVVPNALTLLVPG